MVWEMVYEEENGEVRPEMVKEKKFGKEVVYEEEKRGASELLAFAAHMHILLLPINLLLYSDAETTATESPRSRNDYDASCS
ncbi:unnamed protein product [Angiostrongylus costaricensis]|uniref:Uncharacterized protein n=1 Tax=Angiostrongylus costaricensis TaxID=334426 RepID=A0A0R3PG91_ANGCS|nr:unnamed protein product [Angiostrongylus costaricensis]